MGTLTGRTRWLASPRAAAVACALLVGLGLPSDRLEAACTISVSSGVNFGTYDVFRVAPLDSAGQIRWRCDFLTFPRVRITITPGQGLSFRPRRMFSGTEPLRYNLFLDAARTRIWGDESNGTEAYYQQDWGLGWSTVSVFGQVEALQDAAVGAYSDTAMVVINY